MLTHQIEIPVGYAIQSVTAYEFATEQDAQAALPIFQSINHDMPVGLPDGQQAGPLTNGQIFILKLVGKIVLFILLLLL
jgi:hypothetical protein